MSIYDEIREFKKGNSAYVDNPDGSIVKSGYKLTETVITNNEFKTMAIESGLYTENELKNVDVDKDKERVLTFKGSDESVDRDGDLIRVSGWNLKNYQRNPVFLSYHNWGETPVGRTLKVWKDNETSSSPDGKALMFNVYFPTADISEKADEIYRAYKGKLLSAVSVSFAPLEYNIPEGEVERNELGLGQWGVEYVKQELLELSAVTIPANPNALKLSAKNNSDDSNNHNEKILAILEKIYNKLDNTDRGDKCVNTSVDDNADKNNDDDDYITIDTDLLKEISKLTF